MSKQLEAYLRQLPKTTPNPDPYGETRIIPMPGVQLGRPKKPFFTPERKRNWRVYTVLLIFAFVTAVIASVLVARYITSKDELLASVRSAIREGMSSLVVQQEFKFSPEKEQELVEKSVAAAALAMKEVGLKIALDSPEIKKRDAKIAAQQKMIDGMSREKTKAEAKVAKLEAKNSELESQVDLIQQKLEVATGPEREAIMKNATDHLSREDIEVLILLEKVSSRESSGRLKIDHPWVPLYTWVVKKDWRGRQVRDKDGKLVRVKIPKPGPHNPWIKMIKGVPHDKAIGSAGMMQENVGDWSEEATGIRYTPDQLLREPATYRKVALFQIRKLYRKYNGNPRDVLSVWHSGQPYKVAVKRGLKDLNMSTEKYVDHVENAPITDEAVWVNARRSEGGK